MRIPCVCQPEDATEAICAEIANLEDLQFGWLCVEMIGREYSLRALSVHIDSCRTPSTHDGAHAQLPHADIISDHLGFLTPIQRSIQHSSRIGVKVRRKRRPFEVERHDVLVMTAMLVSAAAIPSTIQKRGVPMLQIRCTIQGRTP